MNRTAAKDFDDYAGRFPADVQERLRTMRRTIQKAAPDATETISYQMPAFRRDRMLVWFGAHATHLGFYPGASGIRAFREELSAYKSAKGSVQFPFDEPLPLALITRIVKYRVEEQLTAAAAPAARARGTAARGPAGRTTAPRPQRRPT